MPSALAIISKAVFETQGANVAIGSVLALDRYASTHKSLDALADGGALFLVTVRPPDEQLWLIAVLEAPLRGKDGWSAAANRVPITDISKLRGRLKFSTGIGITAKPGTLGMSLQTPRVLTADDETLLRRVTGGTSSAKIVKPAATTAAAKIAKSAPTKSTPAKAAKAAKSASGKSAKPAPAAAKAPRSAPAKAAKAAKTATAKTATAKPAPAGPSAAKPVAPTGSDLAALKAAFAAKDGAAALTTALAWWRAERVAALADLIDAISEHASGPAITTEVEFTKLAMAKDPLDLGRMLSVVAELPVNFLPTAAELLAPYPDDPRIARAVARWALEPITTSTSKNVFWTRMFETTARIGDARVIPIFKQRLAKPQPTSTWWDRFYGNIERTIGKMPTPGKLDPTPLATLTAAVGKLSPIGSRVAVRAAAPDVKLDGPLLAQAATHLKAGRIAPAIAVLLERWRETRVPDLADLIARATRLLPTHDLPLAQTTAALQPAWMAAFDADPQAAMPQLLQNVNHGSAKLAELRFAQLATLPDDPRIAIRLAELSGSGASPEAGQYWTKLFEIIARTRDIRTCAPLRATFRDFTSTYYYHHKKGKRIVGKFAITPEASFPSWPLALDTADQALVAGVERGLAAAEAKASRERELIAAIADDWADDGPRLIYADWLLERDHPRGELIVLDCKAARTDAETTRLAELAKVPYIHGMLEDFAAAPLVRDRGLVRTLVHDFYTGTLTWRELASYPLLALVETLDLDSHLNFPTAEDLARVLERATSLRTIEHAPGVQDQEWAVMEPVVKGRFKRAGTDLVRSK